MSRLPPIEFVRGDTKIFEITLQDNDTHTPLDLTGATVTSQIRDTAEGLVVLANATCVLTNATGGVFKVTYAAADTATLVPGTLYFDIQIAFADGTIRTIWAGRKAKVIGDVTK